MRKRLLSLFLAFLFLFITIIPHTTVEAEVGKITTPDDVSKRLQGAGTETDPWLISDVESLYSFLSIANDGSGFNFHGFYVKLVNDVIVNDISDFASWTTDSYSRLNVWNGINEFDGTFDGAGHEISGLYILNEKDDLGFFNYSADSTIQNVVFSNVYVSYGPNKNIGTIVGHANETEISNLKINQGTMQDFTSDEKNALGGIIGKSQKISVSGCTYNGKINGNCKITEGIGGIIGYAEGTCDIISSSSLGKIDFTLGKPAWSYMGGIIGKSNCNVENSAGITVTNCKNEMDISGCGYAGGIAGSIEYKAIDYGDQESKVLQCSNSGNMMSECSGGIVAFAGGMIKIYQSYNTGTVNGNQYSGGVLGYIHNTSCAEAELLDSYNIGDVICENGYSGGIVGLIVSGTTSYTKVSNCFFYQQPEKTESAYGIAARLVFSGWAFTGATFENVFYPSGMKGYPDPEGEIDWFTVNNVCDTDEMNSVLQGFDFENVWKIGHHYPILRWQKSEEGESIENNQNRLSMGWPLLNIWYTFYDSENQRENILKAFLYPNNGILGVLIETVYSLFDFQGFCFGLSMLAAADYNGQINIQSYTKQAGNSLNEYGYTGTEIRKEKKNNVEESDAFLYTCKDENLRYTILQAQWSQVSLNLKKAEVLKNITKDSDIVFEIQNEIKNHPLVVKITAENFKHAVAIAKDEKPIYENGKYWFKVYDCNAPYVDLKRINDGTHLSKYYNVPSSLIGIDNDNKTLEVYEYDQSKKERNLMAKVSYEKAHKDFHFYDTTKLDDNFWNKDGWVTSTEKTSRIFSNGNNLKVSGSNDTCLAVVNEYNVDYLANNVEWDWYCGDNNEETKLGWLTYPRNDVDIVLGENGGNIVRVEDGDSSVVSVHTDGITEVAMKETNDLILKSDNDNTNFAIGLWNEGQDHGIIKGVINASETVHISDIDLGGTSIDYTGNKDDISANKYDEDGKLVEKIPINSHKAGTPSGVTGDAGFIGGTTSAMEYRMVSSEDWTTCSDGTTEVEPGDYEVRMKETDELAASDPITVTVTKKDSGHEETDEEILSRVSGGAEKITGTNENMEYSPSNSDEWKNCKEGSTEAEPGEYKVRLKATESKPASDPVIVIVTEKVNDEDRPSDSKEALRNVSGGEEKILGTTTNMEYSPSGLNAWSDCSDTETQVRPGKYDVRIKATDNTEASASIRVTVRKIKTAEESKRTIHPDALEKEEQHTHHYEWKVVREATEDQDGEIDYLCSDCGEVEYRSMLSSFYVFNRNLSESIRRCWKNGTLVVDATKRGWISFSSMVLQALKDRPDVMLQLKYNYKGTTYEMLIPAGQYDELKKLFDKSSVKDSQGNGLYCGYLNLATKYPAKKVK